MDIRKLIREEVNDFDWAKEVNPLRHGQYYIDAWGLSREEKIELQQKLLDLGFRWGDTSSGGPNEINTWSLNTSQGYTTYGDENRIYYALKPYDEATLRWLKYLSYDDFLELVNGTSSINEENDFEWLSDVGTDYRINDCGELSVGDRVTVTSNYELIDAVEQVGTVTEFKMVGNKLNFIVKFDVIFNDDLHDGGDNYDEDYSSWFFECDDLGVDIIMKTA